MWRVLVITLLLGITWHPVYSAEAPVASDFIFPVGNPAMGARHKISQLFQGYFCPKQNECWRGHLGIDVECPVGTSLRAVANGTVAFARDDGKNWGRVLIIGHILPDGSPVYSLYGHVVAFHCRVGDVVAKGDDIAASGNMGSGPHLHFELKSKAIPGPGYDGSTDSSNTESSICQGVTHWNPLLFLKRHQQSGLCVYRTIPIDGERLASYRSSPTVYFSEPVDLSSLQGRVTITPALPYRSMSPNASSEPDNCQSVVLWYMPVLKPHATYHVTLHPGIRGISGRQLEKPFTFSFRPVDPCLASAYSDEPESRYIDILPYLHPDSDGEPQDRVARLSGRERCFYIRFIFFSGDAKPSDSFSWLIKRGNTTVIQQQLSTAKYLKGKLFVATVRVPVKGTKLAAPGSWYIYITRNGEKYGGEDFTTAID